MANFILSDGSTTAQTLAVGESGVITATGSLVLFGGASAVSLIGSGTALTVAGVISSRFSAISGTGNHRLDVTATGAITSYSSALNITAGSAQVTNAGTMVGEARAISIVGDFLTLSNSGIMQGMGSAGVLAQAELLVSISNAGQITGSDYGVFSNGAGSDSIANSGHISGNVASLFLSDAVSSVLNAGVLLGRVYLNGGADFFDGTLGVQGVVDGYTGNDTIRGGAGSETLVGGAGADRLAGNGGDDSMAGDADYDQLRGGAGDDTLQGGLGADTIWGGTDHDQLRGDDADDRLLGDSGDDTVYGDAGADTAFGGEGDDIIYGDAGADRLIGGAGNDSLYGGTEADTFVFSRDQGTDRVGGFQNGVDRLDLRDFGFSNFAQVNALATASGPGLRIDLPGEGMLFLQSFAKANFDASDVIL